MGGAGGVVLNQAAGPPVSLPFTFQTHPWAFSVASCAAWGLVTHNATSVTARNCFFCVLVEAGSSFWVLLGADAGGARALRA